MASSLAMIRGLAAGSSMMIFASGKTTTRSSLRGGIHFLGTRGLARTTPRRAIGFSTSSSTSKTTIQRRAREAYTHSKQAPLRILQQTRSRFFHTSRARRSQVNPSPNPTANLGSPNESLSLGQRMRKLSREYGWSAVGVYLALSALDFPFCYLLVRYLGTDLIGEWEHAIVSNVKRLIPDYVKAKWHEYTEAVKEAERQMTGKQEVSGHVEMVGWGVEQAQERNKRDASLATQLALAYAIHKSFIFIRVPLTAAVTPKVVRVLRGWGWDIGKRTTKEAKAIKRSLGSNPAAK